MVIQTGITSVDEALTFKGIKVPTNLTVGDSSYPCDCLLRRPRAFSVLVCMLGESQQYDMFGTLDVRRMLERPHHSLYTQIVPSRTCLAPALAQAPGPVF